MSTTLAVRRRRNSLRSTWCAGCERKWTCRAAPVINNTTASAGRSDAAAAGEMDDLIGIMQELAGNAGHVGPLLAKELEPLRTRLPGDFKELDALRLIDQPALCREMLDRLQPRLAARLAGEEDA
jgi:hypothetical protein